MSILSLLCSHVLWNGELVAINIRYQQGRQILELELALLIQYCAQIFYSSSTEIKFS